MGNAMGQKIDITYDQDGRLATETFIKDYEGEGASLGEQAAAAAMRVIFGSGQAAGEMAADAFRCQHAIHAFQGMLARADENRKAIREMFKELFKDDESMTPATTNETQ
jgi:hypothetical protein